MNLTVLIFLLTGISISCSVLFFPTVRLFRVRIGGYWLIALVGAALVLLCGQLPPSRLGDAFFTDSAINPLKILVLFFSMTFLSVYLDEIGFFRYLASLAAARGNGNEKRLFLILYLLVAVLTIFTSNDIIILTFTPFICCFCKNAGVTPLPFLFGEFVAANTWSMFLVIGNPTNIYLATAADIGFFDYLRVMFLPTLVAGTISFLLLLFLFRHSLAQPMHVPERDDARPPRLPLVLGLSHLALCVVLLAVSSYIGIEMYAVSLALAASLLLLSLLFSIGKKERRAFLSRSLRRLPFPLAPFLLSMFVLVLALDEAGTTRVLSELLLSRGDPVFTVGATSFLTANVINNIPMSVLFSDILRFAAPRAETYRAGVFAAVIGSNLGAYLTPLGALAGIMWLSILSRFGVSLKFRDFLRFGAVVAIPSLAAALAVLALVI